MNEESGSVAALDNPSVMGHWAPPERMGWGKAMTMTHDGHSLPESPVELQMDDSGGISKLFKDTSGILCSVLGSLVQKRQGATGEVQWRATRMFKGLEHLS